MMTNWLEWAYEKNAIWSRAKANAKLQSTAGLTENMLKGGPDSSWTISPKTYNDVNIWKNQKVNLRQSRGELASLASPHTSTAGDSCQTASLLLRMPEKHPVIKTSEGRREGTGGGKNQRAREDHMLQSSSVVFKNLCHDEAPKGSGF